MMDSSAIYCCLQNFPNTTLKLISILLDLNAWFVLLVVSWYLTLIKTTFFFSYYIQLPTICFAFSAFARLVLILKKMEASKRL